MRRLLSGFFVVVAFAGGTYFLVKTFQQNNVQPAYATVWPTPMPLPDFNLMDHTGRSVGRENLDGKWHLVFFGFTHCPDICPATLQQLSIARQKLVESGARIPEIILITVDPERDSPQIMASYVGHFGPGVSGLTGKLDELRKLTSTAGIFFEKVPLENGAYTVDHSAVVLLINDDAEIHASFSAPHSVENFVHDLPTLMGAN
ncbi:MAG: SCO family protein [Woeseiaceae bacterium]